jgi:alkylation response protein AidB-like acyl-CoA dehydrogenase
LWFEDIERAPGKFFEAHRMLATRANELGPGFWIRFTVQYNLCAGTVVALGDSKQREKLREMQTRGLLGCFCLTERLAGVNSGLVVNTRATYDETTKTFAIDSGGADGTKNWISQGLTADVGVVVADLVVKGKSHGPHGFLVTFREGITRRLARGVTMGDMGVKTTGNDLDNAWVRFDGFTVPHDALLCKYGGVDANSGEYVAKQPGIRTMDMIGQRLFTGRVAVAQAALVFTRRLFDDTKRYSDQKRCTMRGSSPTLTDVPQLKALYAEGYATLDRLDAYVKTCEEELNTCLLARTIPKAVLVQAIAVAKIQAVDRCIDLAFRLKQEVGSYALMAGTGFDNTDFLQCCKFAEGDSRILSQKLSRDCYGAFKRNDTKCETGVRSEIELDLCQRIDSVVEAAHGANMGKIEAWDCAWREIYQLAEVICERVMHERSNPQARAKL